MQRRWQAYLDGAPLRTQQHAQQPADAAAQQQQQQQQQQGGGGGGSEWQQQDFGAVVSRSDDVAGGSPKRMHEELEPLGPSAGQLPAAAAGSLLQANGLEGGGKRHRHAAEDADAEDGETVRGASPAAQLSQHLQQALGSAAMAVDSPRQQPTEQQQQQQQAGAAQPSTAEAGGTPAAELAAQLAAALQQAVAAGELPAAAYPPPKVQQPSARQRKLLPPGVTLTSAFLLAVAAAAAKAAAAAGSGSSAAANPDAVAALLVRHLPPAVAAAAEVAKGHLNFELAPAGPSEATAAAAAAAAGAAVAGEGAAGQGAVNSGQKGAQQSKKQQAQQAQRQQQQSQQQQAQQQQGIPRGVPRHFELRTLPSSDPSLVQAEFRLFKKYQASWMILSDQNSVRSTAWQSPRRPCRVAPHCSACSCLTMELISSLSPHLAFTAPIQVVHHGDKPGEVTQSSFRNFLIDSPLVHQGPEQFPQGERQSAGCWRELKRRESGPSDSFAPNP